MAIVSTLWSLALLTAIALSLSLTGNVSYRLAQNSFQAISDDVLANAGINRAVLALLDPRPQKHWSARGTMEQFDFAGRTIRVRIQDELGRIDLNQTDGSILIRLFQSAGLELTAAGALADKVLDWRDSNGLKHANGATAEDYRAAGLGYSPRRGPFQSIDELTLVMGMTSDVYKRVEPALTVYSGRQFVDPQFATSEVLSALQGVANGNAAAGNLQPAPADGLTYGVIGPPMNALRGRAFTIDTEISRAATTVRRHSVVRLTGNPNEPFWILNWQRS